VIGFGNPRETTKNFLANGQEVAERGFAFLRLDKYFSIDQIVLPNLPSRA